MVARLTPRAGDAKCASEIGACTHGHDGNGDALLQRRVHAEQPVGNFVQRSVAADAEDHGVAGADRIPCQANGMAGGLGYDGIKGQTNLCQI